MQKLMLGDDAIAQGAIDAGLSGVYAYPGTPSTEITEYIQNSKIAKERKIHSIWSANEKTAMESALGMAYAGKRSMACMKHVGLNVAADNFMNAAITGVNGGMVIVVADDPSMHSSQNEQDSRFFAKFALIPVLEPSNQQEAYDMTYGAFEFSEKYKVPVMIRITTRVAHSRAGVITKELKPENQIKLPSDPRQFVLLPVIARKQYKVLLGNQVHFNTESENSVFNKYFEGSDKSMGVIACGLAYNYLRENLLEEDCKFPVLKIAQYPIPEKQVKQIAAETESLLVLEEGYPIVEEMIKGFLEKENVKGRLDGTLPRDGELNSDLVAISLGLSTQKSGLETPDFIAGRPPGMCPGCGHIDVYRALNEALEPYGNGRVFADIGCYTLGALAPFNAINTTVDMGASITMAKGAADAGLIPSVSMIGDSTFTHSGMTGLLDAVVENTPITVVISDNESTSMTGGQDSAAMGKIEDICAGLGVHPDHIRVFIPIKRNHDEMVKIMREEFDYDGPSVLIPRRECIQKASRRKKEEAKKRKNK